jgi:hypothetical protein
MIPIPSGETDVYGEPASSGHQTAPCPEGFAYYQETEQCISVPASSPLGEPGYRCEPGGERWPEPGAPPPRCSQGEETVFVPSPP